MSAGDLAPLAERLVELDDATRKSLVKPLRELARSGQWGDPPRHLLRGLAIAGPAVLPDARSTVAWVRRFATWLPDEEELSYDPHGNRVETLSPTAGHVVEVLVRRDPPWLPTVVNLLAERLRFDHYRPDDYLLIDNLRTRAAMPPPAAPVFVAMWVRTAWRGHHDDGDAVGLVRAEPAYAELVPLAFDVDEIAGAMRERDQLRHLADTGAVDRDALIDACLARLQRGGRPQPTNEFVRDLDSLTPTTDEVAARTRSYLVLVAPGSATSVAAMAQRDLLRLDSAGRLSGDELLEMSQSVLLRTEKKILRGQLKHLEAHAREVPEDVDLVAHATCVALSNAAPDIQRNAVDVLTRLTTTLQPPTVAAVSTAAESLPADLRERLSAGLAIGEATVAPDTPVITLPPVPDRPGPVKPITSVDEVVEELAAIVHSEPMQARGVDLDRVVEALPRLGDGDREALRRAAAPIIGRGTYQYYLEHGGEFDFTLRRALVALLASCLGDDWVRPAPDFHARRRGAPGRAMCLRIFSLAESVHADRRVRVVALPSTNDGAVDPTDLHDRLARAAVDGWEPDDVDLEQALLRLDLSTAVAEPFASLAGDAGSRVAAWVRHGGHRAPRVQVGVAKGHLDALRTMTQRRADAKPRSSPTPDQGPHPEPLQVGPLWAALGTSPKPRNDSGAGWDPDAAFETWPLVLPHERELLAAHLLPELSRARESRSQGLAAMVDLTERPGPAGTALLVGLAYTAAGKHHDARSAAADGLIVLAGQGQLDGAAFGKVLSAMIEHGDIVAGRLAPALGDAARGGAAAQIWVAVSTLLAPLLRRASQPSGLVDVLVLAAEVATLAGAHGTIDGLDEFAGRKGRTRQLVEARRLREVLVPDPHRPCAGSRGP